MTSTWYPRFMRALGWSLLGVSILVLIGGAMLGFSYTDMYGWTGWGGGAVSQGWWVLAVAAVPAIAGWLMLRIAAKAQQRPVHRRLHVETVAPHRSVRARILGCAVGGFLATEARSRRP